jgi:hypothetical protein
MDPGLFNVPEMNSLRICNTKTFGVADPEVSISVALDSLLFRALILG